MIATDATVNFAKTAPSATDFAAGGIARRSCFAPLESQIIIGAMACIVLLT
jgi:hypothetical protein